MVGRRLNKKKIGREHLSNQLQHCLYDSLGLVGLVKRNTLSSSYHITVQTSITTLLRLDSLGWI